MDSSVARASFPPNFCENRLSSFFCVILLTDEQINAAESITSLAEVIKCGRVYTLRGSRAMCVVAV